MATDWRKRSRQIAQEEGYDPDLFERQIGVESNFNPSARSPAGAIGIAQIMPGTARGWGVDPNNPEAALRAAARNMAQYSKQYGVRGALVAYNAGPGRVGKPLYDETRNYVNKIMGGANSGAISPQRQAASGAGAPTPTGSGSSNLFDFFARTTPTTNPLQAQLQQGWQLLSRLQAQRTASASPNQGSPAVNMFSGPSFQGGGGKVSVRKGADRAGVHTNPAVVDFVKQIAGIAGTQLEIGTGTNHSQMTTSGNVSDHWTGKAADIPAAGNQLTKIGQDALIAAGMDPREAKKQKGGLYNINGYQIIFNTTEGGNHWNHLHVGLGRKLK